MYEPADDLLITPLPDLMLGFAVALLADLPLVVMYPLPERFTVPDALAALTVSYTHLRANETLRYLLIRVMV